MSNQASPTQNLNILVLGRSGVGKSTLINAVLQNDRADTGIGRPITQKVKRYSKLGLGLYDTPGLEDGEKQFNEVRKAVSKLIKELKQQEPHEHIHAVWYCFNYHQPRYLDNDLKWIHELGKNLPVIVIFTRAPEPKHDELIEEFVAKLKDEEFHPCAVVPFLAKPIGQNTPHGVDLLEKLTLQLSERARDKAISDRVEELGRKAFIYAVARTIEFSALIPASMIPGLNLVRLVPIKSRVLQAAQTILLKEISKRFNLPIEDEILMQIIASGLTTIEFSLQMPNDITIDGTTVDEILQNLPFADIFDRLTQAFPGMADVLIDRASLFNALLRGGKDALSTLLLSIAYIGILKQYKIRAYRSEDISQYSLVNDFVNKCKEVTEQFMKPGFGF